VAEPIGHDHLSSAKPDTISVPFASMRELCLLCLYLLAGMPQTPVSSPARAEPLFQNGKTWEQFLDNISAQRDLWLRTESAVSMPSELVERVSRTSPGLQILVVAENWCPDSAFTVPYVARLARSAGVPLRIVDRSAGEPLIATHRTPDGRTATPTVVLLRNGRYVGAWVERPAELQAMFLSMSTNPESAQRFSQRQIWYESDRGLSTLREIVTLIEATRDKE
jgi:hypothetical protein